MQSIVIHPPATAILNPATLTVLVIWYAVIALVWVTWIVWRAYQRRRKLERTIRVMLGEVLGEEREVKK